MLSNIKHFDNNIIIIYYDYLTNFIQFRSQLGISYLHRMHHYVQLNVYLMQVAYKPEADSALSYITETGDKEPSTH